MQALKTSEELSLKGKVCIVTGANSGIGKATATELASMGATVVMVARNQQKGENTKQEIERETGSKSVELLLSDLSSLGSVRELAGSIVKNYSKIDVLVNNAGLFNQRRQVTVDGYESTFETNYLAPFLLTNLLLDRLKESAPSRIINVSSVGHYGGHINFEDLNLERDYGGWKAYQQSKLALVLFTRELAKRLQGTGVTVNSVHPGTVATNIWSRPLGPVGFIMSVPKLFMKSAKDGAKTVVYLASSPKVANVSGQYWDDLNVKQSSPESYDEKVAAKLWDASEQLTNLQSRKVLA